MYGFQSIKRQLDLELTSKEYWMKYLHNKDISYGYYENIDSVMVCDKNKRNLALYQKDGYVIKKVFSNNVLIGKNNGDKQKEGDLKTPLGAYNLTKKLKNIDPFYGPLALVTSYPNLYDKFRNKTGHGIWIHGVPLDNKREEYTKGCIALDNSHLKKLNKTITLKKSILLIGDKHNYTINKDDIATILSNLFQWRYYWIYNDLTNYLSFYHTDFKRSGYMNKRQFSAYKQKVFAKRESKQILFKTIDIIPNPNQENKKIFKIIIDEDYRSDNVKFKGKKELYIELIDNKISILTEK